MLTEFVSQFGVYYGTHLISSVVHNLIHLPIEVIAQNTPLDDIGTWEFESFNTKLKIFARRENVFLQQAYNRRIEKYNCHEKKTSSPKPKNQISFLDKHIYDETTNNVTKRMYTQFVYSDKFKIDCSNNHKWFLTKKRKLWNFLKRIKQSIAIKKFCQQKFVAEK